MDEEIQRAVIQEAKVGNKFILDNVSYHPRHGSGIGFVHVHMQGDLELDISSGQIRATATVRDAGTEHSHYDREQVKRQTNAAYKVPVSGIAHYVPGKSVSLYTGDWSFHCLIKPQTQQKDQKVSV